MIRRLLFLTTEENETTKREVEQRARFTHFDIFNMQMLFAACYIVSRNILPNFIPRALLFYVIACKFSRAGISRRSVISSKIARLSNCERSHHMYAVTDWETKRFFRGWKKKSRETLFGKKCIILEIISRVVLCILSNNNTSYKNTSYTLALYSLLRCKKTFTTFQEYLILRNI